MKKIKTKGYKFNKEKHHHSLNDIPLHGTTTILGIIAKPQLIPWAVKSATINIKEQWEPNKKYTQKQIDEILETGRVKHTSIKTSAGDVGTNVHEAISKWIEAGCPTAWEFIEKLIGTDEQVLRMFVRFVEWTLSNKVEFIFSEKNVWSEKLWFGGICDFACIISGKKYIGDIKTGSGIYPEHLLQCGAYDIALNEMMGFEADGYIIVNIKKDATIQTKQVDETYIYKQGFTHALNLYKVMKELK